MQYKQINQSFLNWFWFWMPFLNCLFLSFLFFMMWNTDNSVSVLIYLAFLPVCFFGVCEILWKKHKEIQELRQQIEEIKVYMGDSKKILSDPN